MVEKMPQITLYFIYFQQGAHSAKEVPASTNYNANAALSHITSLTFFIHEAIQYLNVDTIKINMNPPGVMTIFIGGVVQKLNHSQSTGSYFCRCFTHITPIML